MARSKSSEELLVENAQQLLRAVSKTVRAAEAASLRVSANPKGGHWHRHAQDHDSGHRLRATLQTFMRKLYLLLSY